MTKPIFFFFFFTILGLHFPFPATKEGDGWLPLPSSHTAIGWFDVRPCGRLGAKLPLGSDIPAFDQNVLCGHGQQNITIFFFWVPWTCGEGERSP
jgi:hypothetical protein